MHLSFDCQHTYPSGFALQLSWSTTADRVGLYGPSGSGKSSVIRLLSGVWQARAARIVFGDETLLDTKQGVCVAPERRGFGVVFQDQHLFPHLSVADNLAYAARRAQAPQRIERSAVIELLRLDGLQQQSPQTLSGGERQRVALARALLTQPRLLLLDEPLAAVDGAHRLEILEQLADIAQRWSLPLLVVSHDQSDLRRLTEEVFVLRDGAVAASGPPEILSDPRMQPGQQVNNVLQLERVAGHPDQARLGDATLQLPPNLQQGGPLVFATVSSGAIALSAQPSDALSIRNTLAATVRTTVEQDGVVFVRVDVGQELWVAITPSAARELDLTAGARLWCLIKTHSLGPLS